MLSEQRQRMILQVLEEKKSITAGTILTDERMEEYREAAELVLCR